MVQIIERKPILLITLENENFLMDKEGLLLPAQRKAISFYPVPIINISEDMNYNSELTDEIADLFKFLLKDYTQFYDQLSEVIISDKYWTFYSDSKTRVFTTANDLELQLTEKEINFLILFTQSSNPLTRKFILKNVWNYSTESDTHTIETHIHRLRKKILQKFNDNNFIKNNDKGYFI